MRTLLLDEGQKKLLRIALKYLWEATYSDEDMEKAYTKYSEKEKALKNRKALREQIQYLYSQIQ